MTQSAQLNKLKVPLDMLTVTAHCLDTVSQLANVTKARGIVCTWNLKNWSVATHSKLKTAAKFFFQSTNKKWNNELIMSLTCRPQRSLPPFFIHCFDISDPPAFTGRRLGFDTSTNSHSPLSPLCCFLVSHTLAPPLYLVRPSLKGPLSPHFSLT